jgi:putative pyruvate formate lyase activating enzyme
MNYRDLYQSGELLQRVKKAYRRLASCDLCPHDCGVNRVMNQRGVCGAGLKPKIASTNVHRGEEPPISGDNGSGTVFLSGCSLKCMFCQNFPISQLGNGAEVSTRELANRMVKLQRLGVHNINFVTPTHYLPHILAALWQSVPLGFRIPVVWNSSGYEKTDVLHLLEGIVDIYLPDMKYSDEKRSVDISAAPGYRDINRAAVTEMLRQVGHLRMDDNGIAVKGLIVRHLVLPEGAAGSRDTLKWIADHLGTETHLALMNQYFPAHRAIESNVLGRKIHSEEYDEVVAFLDEYGLENGWVQD